LTFNSLYSFKVNSRGTVEEITKIRDKFIGEDKVKACISSWQFSGISNKKPFVVYFNWKHGTGWREQRVSGNGLTHVMSFEK